MTVAAMKRFIGERDGDRRGGCLKSDIPLFTFLILCRESAFDFIGGIFPVIVIT